MWFRSRSALVECSEEAADPADTVRGHDRLNGSKVINPCMNADEYREAMLILKEGGTPTVACCTHRSRECQPSSECRFFSLRRALEVVSSVLDVPKAAYDLYVPISISGR